LSDFGRNFNALELLEFRLEGIRRVEDYNFPMFAKVQTVSGPDQSPIYSFLAGSGHLPAWNFAKYVVGKDGKVLAFFPSEVTPESFQLRSAITKALAAN